MKNYEKIRFCMKKPYLNVIIYYKTVSKMPNCEFCQKDFSTKGTLLSHQKTAKYCLEIQGKNVENNSNFKCEYCDKTFTLKHNLNDHISICKEKPKKEIENRYKKLIKEHNNEIKKIREEHDKEISYHEREHKKDIEVLNQIIGKLESKLENYEKRLFDMASRPNTTHTNNNNKTVVINNDDNSEEKKDIPLTVDEKIQCALFINELTKQQELEDNKEKLQETKLVLNEVTVTSRKDDGYINATELCKAGNKKFSHWNSLDTTKELINVLSSDAGIPATLLVETKRGQTTKFDQGSWIHPDLAIQLAQWISPSFALQVSKWIRTLFSKGDVSIDLQLLKHKEQEINDKNTRIKMLENVCLSKQRREEYPEKNVIYILTTEDHLKRRTYIVGKAKNLTNRLGTYNKTCDHKVVYYKECKTEEDMTTAETLVLSKLKDYKEQANRDRFILPEDTHISLFTKIVDECIFFVSTK